MFGSEGGFTIWDFGGSDVKAQGLWCLGLFRSNGVVFGDVGFYSVWG